MNVALADVIELHKAGLGKSASRFAAADDADLHRHVRKALSAFTQFRKSTTRGTLQLIAGVSDYSAPANMIAAAGSNWGVKRLDPWHPAYGPLPKISCYVADGSPMIHLYPAPTADQIATFGRTYPYFYVLRHEMTADNSSISPADLGVFLLMTLIEAMRELVASGVTEPVSLQRGMGVVSSNMTPAGALAVLTEQLERQK